MADLKKRLLVVGGGGSRGAWGAGFAQYLRNNIHKRPYTFVVGTSTGSLMAPLIVLDQFEKLKSAYTGVTQKDIFNVNPFRPDGELRPLLAIWRLILGKKTFGETQNLKKLIEQFLTPEDYALIIGAHPGAQFMVTALNYKNGQVHYQASSPEVSWEEMVNWIWASANEPIFMSFVDAPYLAGGAYVDGGVRQNVPVMQAMSYARKLGISEIDIIVNKPKDPILNKKFSPGGILKNLLRLIELWETEVRNDNIIIAKLLDELGQTETPTVDLNIAEPQKEAIHLSFHFIPQEVYESNQNELLFDRTRMKNMWDLGVEGKEDKETRFDMNISHQKIDHLTRKHPILNR